MSSAIGHVRDRLRGRRPAVCPRCRNRFESEADLAEHLDQGSGCPQAA